jgi:hypothetical protein
VKTIEEITYEAGRHALGEQESLVAGIRHRTGTLLAAHALVASLLGGPALNDGAPGPPGYVALALLVLGLVTAALLLAPWGLDFALDAREVYDKLSFHASPPPGVESSRWLAVAGFSYDELRRRNAVVVRRLSRLSALLAGLLVVETVCWLASLGVHW